LTIYSRFLRKVKSHAPALTDNRIELMQGVADKKPLVLKVRVGKGPRKFFNQIVNECECLLKRDWEGDFSTVTAILVIEINNHDYNF
uniref:hypothetical protein n=1 Tax=Bacteroides acidifaciens TaxID=85831 RepID=UPI0030157F3C